MLNIRNRIRTDKNSSKPDQIRIRLEDMYHLHPYVSPRTSLPYYSVLPHLKHRRIDLPQSIIQLVNQRIAKLGKLQEYRSKWQLDQR